MNLDKRTLGEGELSLKNKLTKMMNNIDEERLSEERIVYEDRIIYNESHLKEVGIEFNSPEFYRWKDQNKNLYFPALDAPWQVRKAWREVKESFLYSHSDNANSFFSLENHMHENINKVNGLFCSMRLKTINDYINLIEIATSTYKEIYERTSNSLYEEYIKLLAAA